MAKLSGFSRTVLLVPILVFFSHQIKQEVSVFAFQQIPIGRNFPSFQKKATLRASASQDSSTDLSEFKTWCTEQGIITPLDLRLREENDNANEREKSEYRFMEYSDNQSFTNRPEKLGGPILGVPLKSCIIADTPEELSIELAKERDLGDKSFFAPYIKVLPALESSSLQSMPRMWSDEKMDKVSEFDGGQIYQKVQTASIKNKDLNLDPWAHACVTSRANYLLDKGYAMTPILDMINHDSASKTSARIIEDELFLSVGEEFSKGEEVFISYGELTNLETFCNYGFVSETNGFNTEFVDVNMIRRLPVRVIIDDQSDGSLDAGSIATLRSYLTPPEDVDALLASDENLSMNTVFTKRISKTNEEEVYSFIASFVDEAIYEGNTGIHWARENGDTLLETYLVARVNVLKKGLQFMKSKFPDLLY